MMNGDREGLVQKYLLKIFLIIVCSFCIIQSERFQQIASPKRYWEKNVQQLIDAINQEEYKIQTMQVAYDRQKALFVYELKEAEAEALHKEKDLSLLKKDRQRGQEVRLSHLQGELSELHRKKREKEKSLQEAQTKLLFFQ